MSGDRFRNAEGASVVQEMVKVIADQRQYLSDIDGLIGDGDHGINMDKGFQLCSRQIDPAHMDLSSSLRLLGDTLMEEIGGSMGPLYGMAFRAMARASKDAEWIDAVVFAEMLHQAEEKVRLVGECVEGDKTILDVLAPARRAFVDAWTISSDFIVALATMGEAAEAGRVATTGMIAQKGRSSRLGERSRGVPDAGATSCALLLDAMGRVAAHLIASNRTRESDPTVWHRTNAIGST